MKKITFIIAAIIILTVSIKAQINLKLSDSKTPVKTTYNGGSLAGKSKTASLSPAFWAAGIVLLLINPVLVIENKKVYFALTKEISVGKYPYGRLAFEYSHVFRSYSRNQLRFSYNQDFVLPTKGDFYAVCFSGGVGYFTDTENKGIFPQASIGALLPLPIGIFEVIYMYFKARYTFVKGSGNSNITDFSLGTSFLIYY
jgi:hypothetical protein